VRSANGVVAFVGPSLGRTEAKHLSGGKVLPPAGRGDVWRALRLRPRAIALIDGVFEAQPPVWHKELLDALESGVAVFGASSMGALRAAELASFGMVGVGQVYAWVVSGEVDDADVALLHGDAEVEHRPFTVPFVNIKHAAERAVAHQVLVRGEAQLLVDEARRTFYQERTWGGLIEAMTPQWKPATLARWRRFEQAGLPDVKADDARACLEAARSFAESGALSGGLSHFPVPSSAVRHRRLVEGRIQEVPSAEVLERLWTREDSGELVRAGLQRSALAALARALGLTVGEAARERARARWRMLAKQSRQGLDGVEVAHALEELALEEAVLENLPRLIPDAPSADEALANEARLRGLWRP
jgi:hypothetical protein